MSWETIMKYVPLELFKTSSNIKKCNVTRMTTTIGSKAQKSLNGHTDNLQGELV